MHVSDPRFTDVPTGRLADKAYAAAARAHDRADTTQVCIVDDAGMAVSLTHTLGSASGVVTPGLGFGYNDYMNCFDPRPGRPNSVRPGKTRVTMMTPTMVFDQGELRICVGAPGGTKIVTGVLQVIVNVLDHGMTPVEAVSAPRVDFQGDVVQAEARIPLSVTRGLETLGYKVNRRTPLNSTSSAPGDRVARRQADRRLGPAQGRRDGAGYADKVSLEGRVALVTGGGRGIGAATARVMAQQGARVVVSDLDEAPAAEVAGPIGGLAIACDVSKPDSVEAMVADAAKELGRLDILVACAGITRDNLLFKMSDDDWDSVITTHLKGTFLGARAAQSTWSSRATERWSSRPSTSRWAIAARPTTRRRRPGCRGWRGRWRSSWGASTST